jgi:hypothetical protein
LNKPYIAVDSRSGEVIFAGSDIKRLIKYCLKYKDITKYLDVFMNNEEPISFAQLLVEHEVLL